MPARETFRKQDEEGNLLTVQEVENGDMYLYLYIKNEKKRRRFLGYVDVSGHTFVIKREREKHLHRKSNAYGFNEYIIKTAKTFDTVLLSDESGSYFIPLQVISEQGKYLYFKQKGYEKQLFLSLDVINQYKRRPVF